MRLLLPLVSIPILIYGRSAWACDDHDDDDEDAEDAEAPEPPEPPEPAEAPEPPEACDEVASSDDDVDVDIRWDIDVHWKDHDNDRRSQARRLVIDRIEDLEQQLDAATSDLDDDD